MLFFIIAFFLFFYVYIKRMIRDGFSRKIILSFWAIWFISLTMSTFNPYGLYAVSNETYFILMLNVSGFILGFSAVKIGREVYLGKNAYVCYESVSNFLVSKKYLFVLLIGIVLAGMILNKYIYAATYLMLNIDSSIEFMVEDKSGLDYFFYTFFAAPLFYSSNVILAYSLIYNRKFFYDFFSYLYILVFASIGGGRVGFLIVVIAFVFVLFMGGLRVDFKKLLLPFIILFSLIYVVMSYLTAFRRGLLEFTLDNILDGASKLNENFVTYLTLPFRLFDYSIQKDYLSQLGGFHYGLVSFDGIDRYAKLFLRLFSIDIPTIYEKTTLMFQDTWICVSKDLIVNYAYTNAVYHYLDFGIVGVFFIPFAFSAFFRWIVKMFYIQKSTLVLCLMFYLFFILIHTIFSWHINKVYSLGFIIVMTFFICKNRYKSVCR